MPPMTPPTDAPFDPTAVPLADWELVEWRRVKPDRLQLVPGIVLLRLIAELDRLRKAAEQDRSAA